MPELTITADSAKAVEFAASPQLAFSLRIVNRTPEESIQSVSLQTQIRIEATRRLYDEQEQARLRDLFGEPERWSQTLRALLWTHASVNIGPFEKEIAVDLPVACTFDFNVAATKYFAGLDNGDIPVVLLFSGTIFYEDQEGLLRIAQIPWQSEAHLRVPAELWKHMMDHYYPNSAWLTLRRDVFDRLDQFKRDRGIATWDQAVERLLQ